MYVAPLNVLIYLMTRLDELWGVSAATARF